MSVLTAITIKIIMAHYGEHIFNWENVPQGNQIMLEASTDLREQGQLTVKEQNRKNKPR